MIVDRFRRRRTGADHDGSPVPDRASIFVTVGTELPFDRLIRAVDDWAGETGRGGDVFAQIGHGAYEPENVAWRPMLTGSDFRRLFASADLIVSHAGMGTILAALEDDRPLVVVPRRADLREHRNDHQLATVERLSQRGLISAVGETELAAILGSPAYPSYARTFPSRPCSDLLSTVRRFIGALG